MTSSNHSQNPHHESRVGSLLFWLFFHGLVSILLLAVLLLIVPHFEKMFQEFGLKLPVASVLVINLSRCLWRYGLLIIPIGLIFDGAFLYLLIMVGGLPRWLRQLWCHGVLIIAACIVLLVVIALVLPLVGLVEGLS